MTSDELEYWAISGRPSVIPFCGNLRGWISLRKTIPNEDNILG